MKTLLLSAALTFNAILTFATEVQTKETLPHTRTALSFIENKGQVYDQNRQPRPDIQFSLKATPGLNIFIGNGAIHYQFSKADVAVETDKKKITKENASALGKHSMPEPVAYTMYRMDVELIGADQNAQVVTDEKQDYYENYFTDVTGEKGATVHTFNRITYLNIYPHIDWVLFTKNGKLEHEFVVNPGGNPADIKLKYAGATDLKINTDGILTATTPQGAITEQAPYSHDALGLKVESHFVLRENVLSYHTERYTGTLTIDPTLEWATYYGGANSDNGQNVTTTLSGNVLMSGGTTAQANVATIGAYQTTLAGGEDAFIAEFDPSGSLQWATYFGGALIEIGGYMTLDPSGNIYITGGTSSTGLATAGAAQNSLGGNYDAFLAKFTSGGSRLWCTYLGGAATDAASAVATDKLGNVYITGYTASSSGIATPSAHQTVYGGVAVNFGDAFVAKFSTSGTLLWSTYYGGSRDEDGEGIAADSIGNVYVTGTSDDLRGVLSTPGAFKDSATGLDAFLAKFSPQGTLVWGTYFGGVNTETAVGVCLSPTGFVYITGYTYSTDSIGTPGSYNRTSNGGADVYLAKFTATGHRVWGTYYGGYNDDHVYSICSDRRNNIYLAGSTFSNSLMSPPDALHTAGLYYDAFFARFDSMGFLTYGTFFGDTGREIAFGIAADAGNNIYVSGRTSSGQGIATPGAYQTTLIGPAGPNYTNATLLKMRVCNFPVVGALNGPSVLCPGDTVHLSDTTASGVWTHKSGRVSVAGGLVRGISSGTDTVIYTVTNTCGSASVSHAVSVNTSPTLSISASSRSLCQGQAGILSSTVSPSGGSYQWSPLTHIAPAAGNTDTVTVTPDSTMAYHVTYTAPNGCRTKDSVLIAVHVPVAPVITRHGDTLSTNAIGHWVWSFNRSPVAGDTLATLTITSNGTYSLSETDTNGCIILSNFITVSNLSIGEIRTNMMSIHPNPAQTLITISASQPIKEVEISNTLGQVLMTEKYETDTAVVNIAALPAGLYFVKVNESGTYKLVKE